MKEVKDKEWAKDVQLASNALIETELGVFYAYISTGGWASVNIDDETTYNFEQGEYKVIVVLKK